jgi:hypothetical protein
VQGIANAAYLSGLLFSGLPCVAPYCVPGGVRVVSIASIYCTAATVPRYKWFYRMPDVDFGEARNPFTGTPQPLPTSEVQDPGPEWVWPSQLIDLPRLASGGSRGLLPLLLSWGP